MTAAFEPYALCGFKRLDECLAIRDFATSGVEDVKVFRPGVAKSLQTGVRLIVIFGIPRCGNDDDRRIRSSSERNESLEDNPRFLRSAADDERTVLRTDVLTVHRSSHGQKKDRRDD